MIFGVSAWGAAARAESLPDLLLNLIENHDRINAAKNDLEAAHSRIRETRGAWFPEMQVDFNNGFQKRTNPGTQDTTKRFNETTLSITQLLWDFGKTNTDVTISEKNHETAAISLHRVRQDLILEGITAYIQVYSASRRLTLSRQSEDNIKVQTELEDARVAGGSVGCLLGKSTALSFRQVSEGDAIYYLAQFPFKTREVLSFTLNVRQGDDAHRITFNQEMFPDD